MVNDLHSIPDSVNYLNSTYDQFEQTVKTKSCYGEEMKCFGNSCFYKYITNNNNSKLYKDFQCTIKETFIHHENINTPLFGYGCNANTYLCNLPDPIIIWNSSIIHMYPYAYEPINQHHSIIR